MRTLILNRDLKTLLGGVSIAAMAGLLMGGAMYPNLNLDGLKGPQILLRGGGPRGHARPSGGGIGVYGGRVPDYVIGTDSLKPPQDPAMAYKEDAPYAEPDTGEAGDVLAYEAATEAQPAQWRDEPREPVRYPSQAGNTAYEIDLPAPPEPPHPDEEDPVSG